MVAAGGLIRVLGFITFDSLSRGLEKVLPKYRQQSIPLNQKAIRMGMGAVPGASDASRVA